MNANRGAALDFYKRALDYTHSAKLTEELRWQRSLRFADFREPDLLREAAWVVLCSGFREQVVRRKFNFISLCFCDWESSQAIVEAREYCRASALSVFRNERKIGALIRIAEQLADEGFLSFKKRVLEEPIQALQALPFIGSVTALHLAKNLGLEVVKPDRHLANLTIRFGYSSADAMCRELADKTGEDIRVVDLVLWRFMADTSGGRRSYQLLQ